MILKSPDFESSQPIPSKFTCEGEGIHPSFVVENVSSGTQSLTIICDDPDSPSGTWTHWLIWNISPDIRVIKEGEILNSAVEGKNSAGEIGYFGPCPGSGNHRYVFSIFALNQKLNVAQDILMADLKKELEKYLIEKTELIGTYKKKNS